MTTEGSVTTDTAEYYLPESRIIAGYDVVDVMAVDGLTVVLTVKDSQGKSFAMKVPTRSALKDRSLPRRFDREIDIMNKLVGPAFLALRGCGLYAVDSRPNIPYIVTDMPQGETLDVLLQTQKAAAIEPDLQGAVHLLRALSMVLVDVHKAGVVHRNLKPSNICVDAGGEVQILDFVLGLDASPVNLTRDREFVGNNLYISPEQALDPHHVDGRADLYSLGLIIYEYATHKQPFEGTGPSAMSGIIKRFNHDPDPPSRHNPRISPELENILVRLTRRQLNVRFQAAQEVLDAVNQYFPPSAIDLG
jgi:serine/threonine-protein kinase